MTAVDEIVDVSGQKAIVHGSTDAEFCLIQPIMDFDLRTIDAQSSLLDGSAERDYLSISFLVDDWNTELSPWKSPAVFGKEDFGDGAERTLSFIVGELMPFVRGRYLSDKDVKFVIGGYSLAGLFSLWSVYVSDAFYGVAAASPSVWFPGWKDFIDENTVKAERVYLSLGDGEHTARTEIRESVADMIRYQYASLLPRLGNGCVLEWNVGNHFKDINERKAKAFSWVLNG